jgi:anti-sigma factor RsiW
MTPDELEFNICQYLDGTLPDAQRTALEALLEYDAAARQLLAEHRKLDAAMKSVSPLPKLQWDRLADHLANAVEFGSEGLEQTVVQYVDGDLAADERAALEHRLSDDPHVSTLLQQHQRLRAGLRGMPQPRVHWKNLAEHLSKAVADAADPKPIKLYAYSWMRAAAGLAVAACVVLVSSIALHQHWHGTGGIAVKHGPEGPAVAIINVGPDAITPSAAAITDISISAGNNVASAAPAEYADGIVVVQPSRGLIATSAGSGQDIQTPY